MTENQQINAKLTAARTALAESRHKREAMAIAERRNELIEKSLVKRQASYIAITLRQAVLNFPSRFSRAMVGLKSEHAARQVLTAASHEFLRELANFSEKVADPRWLASVEVDGQDKQDGKPSQPAPGQQITAEQQKVKRRREKQAATMRKLRAAGRV
jgi:hypothetical protein